MATRSMPTVVMAAGFDGDLQLGAHAVGGGDQQRVGVAGRLQVEQRPEAAQGRLPPPAGAWLWPAA